MDRLDFGYCIQSPVLSGDECDTLLGTMGNYRTTGRAGTRHTMSIEGVTELANDGRMLRASDTISRKAGICYAHAPARALSRVVALRVHLDSSTSEPGPSRVIPGSHRAGVLTDRDVSDYVNSHDHTICLVPRGGVLAMWPLLIHSSSKAQTDAP
jgi:hypothetical protein